MSSTEELLNQAALIAKTNSEQIGLLSSQVKQHEVTIRELKNGLSGVVDDLESYKLSQKEKEYIEPHQLQELDEAISNRIADIFNQKGIDFKKYFGDFKRKAWRDGKKHSFVVGSAGVYTRRMHFDEVKEFYGEWIPYAYSIEGYIQHLDSLKAR